MQRLSWKKTRSKRRPGCGTARPIVAGLLALGFLCTGRSFAGSEVPYELRTGREITLFTGSALTYGLAILASRDGSPLTVDELGGLSSATINGFDRSATRRWSPRAGRLSDVLRVALALSPLTLLDSEPGTHLAMHAETLLLTAGLTQLTKSLVRRPRPLVFNDSPRVGDARKLERRALRSFPSGHTSSAFAAAVFLSTMYAELHPDDPAEGWVWGGSLALAGTVGLLRYLAGQHYPTDILAGAVLGAAVGYLVPRLHESDDVGRNANPVVLSVGFAF